MLTPTERFSDRVENYVRYRPSYPVGVVDILLRECHLGENSVVADIGSGTGKLTALLLEAGWAVFGVEPNREMREAGEQLLATAPRFKSVAAAAEATGLPSGTVDLVTAGQAFHWFDRSRARTEFMRILKPGGWMALIWNDRRIDATPFLMAYEQLLREFVPEYQQVNHRNIDRVALGEFLGAPPKLQSLPYSQHFDFAALRGRLLSSSYAPEKGQPRHEAMLARLQEIFDAHQNAGTVVFDYDTLVYYGQFA